MKSFYTFSLALLIGGVSLSDVVFANQSYQTTEQGLQTVKSRTSMMM
ncbi:MAG: hypothetical protein SOS93_01330 [Mannheimia varigena]|nr:hypothetical protein [Mannheimia varigena]